MSRVSVCHTIRKVNEFQSQVQAKAQLASLLSSLLKFHLRYASRLRLRRRTLSRRSQPCYNQHASCFSSPHQLLLAAHSNSTDSWLHSHSFAATCPDTAKQRLLPKAQAGTDTVRPPTHLKHAAPAAVQGHSHGGSSAAEKDKEKDKKDKSDKSPAWPIFKRSIPYLWPRDSLWLRFCFIASLVCLLIGSLADLYTPVATKYAVDELSGNVDEDIQPRLPVQWIVLYGVIRFAANFFQQLRDAFFAAVGAETERRVALETFHHLQSLSLSFHLQRETGSVLRSVSRGAQSFATLSRIVLFQIAPIFVQLAVVCVYLATLYPWYFSVLTFSIIAVYFAFTLTTTNWRDRYRRVMNEKDNEFNQKSVDALLNFETVKYFNAEQHEERRYDAALKEYTVANTRTQQSLAVLNAGQNLIISFGIALALYLAARQVLSEDMTVGDFVMVQAFILQLYQPLGFLGTYYRMIKQNIVDVESMFKILEERKDITDSPAARTLQVSKAEITFENVSFAYDSAVPILKNVSFTVRPGMKVAIVGQSGAGKSTIARLLYRFYDVTGGRILVDGQDIREVRTQYSTRTHTVATVWYVVSSCQCCCGSLLVVLLCCVVMCLLCR